MRGSLVPVGIILALGGSGGKSGTIYPELGRRAEAARLTVLDSFDRPLQAGHRAAELAAIRMLTRGLWNRLEIYPRRTRPEPLATTRPHWRLNRARNPSHTATFGPHLQRK
jgi:hypothetical protein